MIYFASMKTIKTLPFILLLLIELIITSCKRPKPDETIPTLMVSNPTSGQTYNAGSRIELKALFSDDIALSQYKIDIHNAFDDHSHKMAAVPWAAIIIEDLDGTSQSIVKEINIPPDAAAGRYDLLIYCLDAAGHESSFQELEINIINPDDVMAPDINISSPTPGSQYTVGDSIHIVGTVTDEQTLKDVEIKIIKEGDSTTVFDYHYEGIASIVKFINLPVSTAVWTQGNYVIKIKARDVTYNVSGLDINIVIN